MLWFYSDPVDDIISHTTFIERQYGSVATMNCSRGLDSKGLGYMEIPSRFRAVCLASGKWRILDIGKNEHTMEI